MNPQIERLFHSVRRGIEQNIQLAVKTLEVSRNKDFKGIKRSLDRIKTSELAALKTKVDDIKRSLERVEALKPYLSAIDRFTGVAPGKAKPKRKAAARRKRTKTPSR